ncbi:MAG TPA: protein kinase [Candidatus Obscuribacter sp.]|nr:protein kinase [Candidatus Obscuribacter sp.]
MSDKAQLDLDERETRNTWGTVPLGSSRLQVRHFVLYLGIALWFIPTLIMTGVHAIAWLAFNAAAIFVLLVVTSGVRAVPLHKLAICFFAGGLCMGLDLAVLTPVVKVLGEGSPLRLFLTVPAEEIAKLLPVLLLLWRGRKFSSWTLGATDILLMGATCGAGFAIVENSFAHCLQKSINNLSVLIPAAEMVNGRIVVGHAIWAGLTAGTLGIASLFRENKKVAIPLALAGFIVASLDHLALNYGQLQAALPWGKTIFDTLAANGYLALALFLVCLTAAMAVDFYVLMRSLPKVKEFGMPSRKDQMDRKETLINFWDCILDLRRLNYAHFRYKVYAEGEAPPYLALSVAVLAKRLVNRYLAAEPVNITVKGTIDKAGVKITLPEMEKPITVMSAGSADGKGQNIIGQTGREQGLSPFDNRPVKEQLDLPEHFEIIEEIASGGMGLIFKARNKRTNASLAIKILHPHLAKNKNFMQRFEQEARAAHNLKHPNIVTVHDFGMTNKGVAYLVMEWLDGPSLEEIIRRHGAIASRRVLSFFTQTAEALAHAHRKGIVHRDIKPSNMLIVRDDTGTEQVKLVDFGIAKVVGDETEEMRLTATGDVLGSPLFMSPEQCMGSAVDFRTDIYSLGCVMYEALCGVPPFKAENSVQVIFKHLNEMPQRPSLVNSNIDKPQALEMILFRCLQKDPAQRFSSMDELAAELKKQAAYFL